MTAQILRVIEIKGWRLRSLLIVAAFLVYAVMFAQPASLEARYTCNGNFDDTSGNGSNGVVYGAVLSSDKNGIANSAYTFDGVDDYVSIPGLGPYNEFTLMARIKFTSTALMNTFTGSYAAWYPSVNGGQVAWYDGLGWRKSTTYINDNEWHDVAYIFDNTSYSIYVDGTIEYTGAGTTSYANGAISGLGKISTNQRYFSGKMDDIHIYNEALSGAMIAYMFSENDQNQWLTNGTSIHYDVGNVGISTPTPAYELDVNGAINATSILVNGQPIQTGPSSQWTTATANIYFNTGSVGIGTDNPQNELDVNGTIHAKEVKVDLNGWPAPDYVFEKDYPLTSLSQLKTFIEQNKHLPEIPSAKEMEANGVNLKEMNLLLLKKVEELTLYILEQETRIKNLESKQH